MITLKSILDKYRNAGWYFEVWKSWSALFFSIKISKVPFPEKEIPVIPNNKTVSKNSLFKKIFH